MTKTFDQLWLKVCPAEDRVAKSLSGMAHGPYINAKQCPHFFLGSNKIAIENAEA